MQMAAYLLKTLQLINLQYYQLQHLRQMQLVWLEVRQMLHHQEEQHLIIIHGHLPEEQLLQQQGYWQEIIIA
ncbi:hypothetical protein D3C87_1871540 [compost metagenome]